MYAAHGLRPQASVGAGGGRHRRPGRRSAHDGGGDPSAVVEVSVPQMCRSKSSIGTQIAGLHWVFTPMVSSAARLNAAEMYEPYSPHGLASGRKDLQVLRSGAWQGDRGLTWLPAKDLEADSPATVRLMLAITPARAA